MSRVYTVELSCRTSSTTHFLRPFSAALCKGHLSSSFWAFVSKPNFRSSCKQPRWPSLAAKCNGVFWNLQKSPNYKFNYTYCDTISEYIIYGTYETWYRQSIIYSYNGRLDDRSSGLSLIVNFEGSPVPPLSAETSTGNWQVGPRGGTFLWVLAVGSGN